MDHPTSVDQQQHPVDTVTPSDPSSGQVVPEEQGQAVVEKSADVPPPPQAVESLSEAAPVAHAPPMETDAVVENGEKEKKAVPESTEIELKEAVSSELMTIGPFVDATSPLTPRARELFSRFEALPPIEQKRLVFSLLTATFDLTPADFDEIEQCELGFKYADYSFAPEYVSSITSNEPGFTLLVEQMKAFAHSEAEFSPLWDKMFEVTRLGEDNFPNEN